MTTTVPEFDWDVDDEDDRVGQDSGFTVQAGTSSQPAYFVASYQVTREYGGPEEGGWAYDAGVITGNPQVFLTKQAALDYATQLRLGYAMDPSTPRPSIVNDYVRYEVRVTSHLPVDHFPATRPHYE